MKRRICLAQNKEDLHDLGSDDLLSQLSDDILVSILSYLPLKDATVTGMLSKRWRYLWCQRVCLDFEDKERLEKIESYAGGINEHIDLIFAERNKYINWVNYTIREHKSPNIDEFKICFHLDVISKDAIGKWIEFAISKNVQRLELALGGFNFCNNRHYDFPNKIFDRKCEFSLKRSSFDVPVSPYATVMEIKFLKALILKCVDVNDEDLKKILSNCPILEHLFIDRSLTLVKAKIHGKGLALKNLEIIYCYGLESIEICDSNIVSFNCSGFFLDGYPVRFRLDNLQSLEKISICDYEMKFSHMFFQNICIMPYLQVLELGFCVPQDEMQFFLFPKLPKLKQLITVVAAKAEGSLSGLISLVEACPNLQRFTVELWWKSSTHGLINRDVGQAASHQHLEVVEIAGYDGQASDLELAMYFIENSVALKKLVVEPYLKVTHGEITNMAYKNAARNRARQQLEPKTPVGVELVIL